VLVARLVLTLFAGRLYTLYFVIVIAGVVFVVSIQLSLYCRSLTPDNYVVRQQVAVLSVRVFAGLYRGTELRVLRAQVLALYLYIEVTRVVVTSGSSTVS